MQSIVERAQVTKGGFYHHFASKQALLHEIHDRFIDYHLERMRELLASRTSPAEELLRRLIRDILVVGAARWRNDIEIFYQERRQLEGERYAAVLHKRHEFEGYVIEVVAARRRRGRAGRPRRPEGRRVRDHRHDDVGVPLVRSGARR